MKTLDIGQVAEQSKIPASTLRYYESLGLIQSVGRNGLRRQFNENVLLKLSLITLGKMADFSLTEIAGMFTDTGKPELPRTLLHTKADEIDERIRHLSTLRKALRHVADCPEASHMECAKFKRILRMATKIQGLEQY